MHTNEGRTDISPCIVQHVCNDHRCSYSEHL